MDAKDLLIDQFTRIHDLYDGIVGDTDAATLNARPGGSNSMAWLLWHLARIQDDHLAGISGDDQVWDDWRERFDLPFEAGDTGYGHSSEQVDAVQVEDPALLGEYHQQVHQATLAYLDRVDGDELDRVVDPRWDPPVTAGVRLVSVIGDCLQHLGQAAYARGMG
jgi:uncharacterized damage-inducible protein DinB